jgi:hypothetical protein
MFTILLFYSAAPTCFDIYVLSSGSSSVPAELHANLMQWLIRLSYTLLCVCYVEAWCIPYLLRLVMLPSAYALGNVTRQIGGYGVNARALTP